MTATPDDLIKDTLDKHYVFDEFGEWAAEDVRDDIIAALSAAGLVIVPREPTQQMIDAWLRADAAYVEGPHGRIIWRAMIEAAAPVQATPKEERGDGNKKPAD